MVTILVYVGDDTGSNYTVSRTVKKLLEEACFANSYFVNSMNVIDMSAYDHNDINTIYIGDCYFNNEASAKSTFDKIKDDEFVTTYVRRRVSNYLNYADISLRDSDEHKNIVIDNASAVLIEILKREYASYNLKILTLPQNPEELDTFKTEHEIMF